MRSSATAEDLPTASFAGQQETYLNVQGLAALLEACRKCFASLFTDRAISYRAERGFEHEKVYLSIGVQKMVRSDLAGSGVMFTLDTESGFDRVVFITAIYGLGENIVQGVANPDEYLVFKPTMAEISRRLGSKEIAMVYDPGGGRGTRNVAVPEALRRQYVLSPEEVLELARYGVAIETHYTQRAGERAADGHRVGQGRPHAAALHRAGAARDGARAPRPGAADDLHARAARTGAGEGPRRRHADRRRPGRAPRQRRRDAPLPAGLRAGHGDDRSRLGADPQARGGDRHRPRRPHLPRGDREPRARHSLRGRHRQRDRRAARRAAGHGHVRRGRDRPGHGRACCRSSKQELRLDQLPATRTKIYINVGNPDQAFDLSFLPVDGVGLAREEFIIAQSIGIHPMALVHPERTDDATRREIAARTRGSAGPTAFYVDRLAEGVARIAAAFYPKPVVVRLSDFKTNEYAGLARRAVLRAARGESDDRLPRRVALLPRRVPRGLRARVPGAAQGARRDGPHQRDRDGAVLPHHRRGGARCRKRWRATDCGAARTACSST